MADALEKSTNLLFEDSEWDFETLQRTQDAIEDIAINDLGLNVFPNQIEIISSEQMLDAYSSHGMPLMYPHWSFGKLFAHHETLYRGGYTALAYEIVINSNPCISYLMEENTMAMQSLVIAHAAYGHNHFFKNNYLFRQWTNAEAILDYLNFSKKYIARCEEEHGAEAVEKIIDSAHALMDQGVFRYSRPPKLNVQQRAERQRKRIAYDQATFNDLWRTLPVNDDARDDEDDAPASDEAHEHMMLPEENVIYFLEKQSPILLPWQREILRIVRNLSQYFYPQKQTKVMNEGCATFVHHYIMNELYNRGMINEGAMLEFLHSHTSVVLQPHFDDPRFNGINPYALGFGMMEDIRRICENPTDEDREWFPDIAGDKDWRSILKDAWTNYRDESFIQQFLSPKLMRDFRFFALMDESAEPYYGVSAIHNKLGYQNVRQSLAASYELAQLEPNIQVVSANLSGDRKLALQHTMHNGVALNEKAKSQVLGHVQRLWGHEVVLESVSDAPDPKS
jgi:spore cortex formation protein SpoVR/YcgB (stage V sporulation)